MRNSEDIGGVPDYQAINSRLIGKPVLSSYLNAREYTPKYEEDKVGQREEGYSGGTDYQALNSRLIGKPVWSSYLSGGRYIPASEEDREDYIEELKANQGYFDSLFRFLHPTKGPRDPNSKMDFNASAAYAGFYPEKFTKESKGKWEGRKKEYLKYLDIPTRAYFFSIEAAENKDKVSVDEIPEELALLMRFPYFRSVASLLGTYLYNNKFVEIIKDADGNEHLKVSRKDFDLAKFMKDVYYPNVVYWSRQVKRELKDKMKPGDDRKEKLEEVKRELREKVNSEAVKEEALAAAEKKEKKIADKINSIIAKLEEKSIEYDDKTVSKLSQDFYATERKRIPGNWADSTYTMNEFRNAVKKEGLNSPRGKAYPAIEKGVVGLLKNHLLTKILQDVDIKTAKIFWHVVIGQRGKPETFIKRLRYPLRGTREPVKYTADDVEEKLKLQEKIKEAAKAAKEKEMEKRQATVKKIKDTRAKNKEAAKKEETTDGEKPATMETTDGEEPASEKATTRKTKKGSAATKREASSTTGTKSRPKVGSAALGSKTTKTPRKKGAKSPPTSTPELPANGVRTTPTKKGTRNKNPVSTSDTLPAAVPPPTPKVRGKKSARPGNKKRVTTGKKKSVPTSAALPPPPAEETSSSAVPPTEEGRGKKRAGTPPSAAPPRKRRTRGANPTARSYDLRERKNVSYD